MMISPESYYEEFLKGKTKEEIMTAIRELKEQMVDLKNIMENPEYDFEYDVSPSEETRLSCKRLYLERAKEAYEEAGGSYILSEAEKRATDFETNIDFISKITFKIGGYFNDYPTYIVKLSGELEAYKKLWDEEEPISLYEYNGEKITKAAFLARLKSLHIGEWLSLYSTLRFDYMMLDGTQWELEFEYINGNKPIKFEGDNSYPYNFDEFLILFGINEDEDL